jgi:hypothetical protein
MEKKLSSLVMQKPVSEKTDRRRSSAKVEKVQ